MLKFRKKYNADNSTIRIKIKDGFFNIRFIRAFALTVFLHLIALMAFRVQRSSHSVNYLHPKTVVTISENIPEIPKEQNYNNLLYKPIKTPENSTPKYIIPSKYNPEVKALYTHSIDKYPIFKSSYNKLSDIVTVNTPIKAIIESSSKINKNINIKKIEEDINRYQDLDKSIYQSITIKIDMDLYHGIPFNMDVISKNCSAQLAAFSLETLKQTTYKRSHNKEIISGIIKISITPEFYS